MITPPRREATLVWLITEIRRLIRDDPTSPGQPLRRGRLKMLGIELKALRAGKPVAGPD